MKDLGKPTNVEHLITIINYSKTASIFYGVKKHRGNWYVYSKLHSLVENFDTKWVRHKESYTTRQLAEDKIYTIKKAKENAKTKTYSQTKET